MQTENEINVNGKWMSLDQVIDMVFDNTVSGQMPTEIDFIKAQERNIMEEIRKYTQSVKDTDFNAADTTELEDVVENLSGSLTDAIFTAHLDYFKNGMKCGASLLLELIGNKDTVQKGE